MVDTGKIVMMLQSRYLWSLTLLLSCSTSFSFQTQYPNFDVNLQQITQIVQSDDGRDPPELLICS